MGDNTKFEGDVAAGLSEIKKEIVEARNLTIKTDNLVQNLSAQVKEIGKRQERYERKYVINSIAAYILFIALIGTGAYYISQEQMKSVKAELDVLDKEKGKLEGELKRVEKERSEAQLNDRIAEEVLALFDEERFEEGLIKWEKVNEEGLSRFARKILKEKVASVRKRLGDDLYERGKNLANARSYDMAIAAFKRVLEMDPKGEASPKALLKWGEVLEKQKKDAEAAEIYKRIATEYPNDALADDGLWFYAQRVDYLGKVQEAADAFETLTERYPESGFAKYAKSRAQTLKSRLESEEKASQKPVSPPSPQTSQQQPPKQAGSSTTSPAPTPTTTKPEPSPKKTAEPGEPPRPLEPE
ncbi:MAG: hypothetical protein Kow0090_17140 [Myxococcota bacterium]